MVSELENNKGSGNTWLLAVHPLGPKFDPCEQDSKECVGPIGGREEERCFQSRTKVQINRKVSGLETILGSTEKSS